MEDHSKQNGGNQNGRFPATLESVVVLKVEQTDGSMKYIVSKYNIVRLYVVETVSLLDYKTLLRGCVVSNHD